MSTFARAAERPLAPASRSGQRCNLALQRLEAKTEIIGQLIDGRLTLLGAAARFRQLSRPAASGVPANGTLESDEDLCRSIIGWVYLALSDRPERAEVLAEQLEAELTAHLQQHGSVNLAS